MKSGAYLALTAVAIALVFWWLYYSWLPPSGEIARTAYKVYVDIKKIDTGAKMTYDRRKCIFRLSSSECIEQIASILNDSNLLHGFPNVSLEYYYNEKLVTVVISEQGQVLGLGVDAKAAHPKQPKEKPTNADGKTENK